MTGNKMRIVVVEDHEDSAVAYCRLLQSCGLAACSVDSVEQLLAKAETESFDVLVCDIGLAGVSGLAIPRLFPSIPAIAVTGYGFASDVQACQAAGFREHVLKPISLPALLAAIDRCNPSERSSTA